MKASELRLGNYVSKESLGVTKINIIDLDKINRYDFDYTEINLTEKWLSDFGFTQTNESEDVEQYNLNGFEIAIHEEDGEVYFVYQHMVLRHIIHVHQLQNLYHALIGSDLQISSITEH